MLDVMRTRPAVFAGVGMVDGSGHSRPARMWRTAAEEKLAICPLLVPPDGLFGFGHDMHGLSGNACRDRSLCADRRWRIGVDGYATSAQRACAKCGNGWLLIHSRAPTEAMLLCRDAGSAYAATSACRHVRVRGRPQQRWPLRTRRGATSMSAVVAEEQCRRGQSLGEFGGPQELAA